MSEELDNQPHNPLRLDSTPESSVASRAYLLQKILTESGVQRVLDAYELVIIACQRKDGDLAIRAIEMLLDAIDYSEPELAKRFETVYVHSLALIPTGRLEEVIQIFERLRGAWTQLLQTDENGSNEEQG